MRLSEITYYDLMTGWHLKRMHLEGQNLLVGKNSTGKTKTLLALKSVIDCLINNILTDCRFSLTFSGDYQLDYQLWLENGIVKAERLQKNGTDLFVREGESCRFYDEEINPPANVLVVNARRDTKKYAEIEEMFKWAEHVSYFIFSNVISARHSSSPFAFKEKFELANMFEKVDHIERLLINYLQMLGYHVEKIWIEEFENNRKTLYLKEEGVKLGLQYMNLSNGLFRVLSVLVYMLYSASLKGARCLIIDDLGEGLDYERSNKLGQIIFNYCRDNDIQLIVTTNDSFLMDTIDLKNWIVLMRNQSEVTTLSADSNPELFRRFKMTGLNNFDLFASDFIQNHINS